MTNAADPESFITTDAVSADLGRAVARGGMVQLGAQLVQLAMYVASGMVMARLLEPEAFGLLAMVGSISAVIVVIRDFGLPMAAVQREELTHGQMSALFWLNALLSALLALALLTVAPVLAWFYDERRLLAITAVTAASTFIVGLASQHESLLVRQMRFGALRAVDLTSTAVSLAAGVAAAVLGAGYWALVLQAAVLALFRTGLAWRLCGWRPLPPRRSRELADRMSSLVSYARDLTAARVLHSAGNSSDKVAIGLVGGAAPLGLYDNAYRWSIYPIQQVYVPLVGVAVSGLSRLQDDPQAYRRAARAGMAPVFAVVVPALAYLALEADSVILLLLGPQWDDAIVLFRILCIAAIARVLGRTTTWLYLSRGATGRQLRFSLVAFPVIVSGVVAGALIDGSAYGIAVGFTAATWVLVVPEIVYCVRDSPVRGFDYLRTVWRPSVAAAIGVLSVLVLESVVTASSDAVRLLVSALVFGFAASATWIGLPGGGAATRNLWQVVVAARAPHHEHEAVR